MLNKIINQALAWLGYHTRVNRALRQVGPLRAFYDGRQQAFEELYPELAPIEGSRRVVASSARARRARRLLLEEGL